jgi:hypothetical protein
MEDRFGNFVQVDYLDCQPATSCVAVALTSPTAGAHGSARPDPWIHLRDTGQPFQALVVTRVDLAALPGAGDLQLLYNDSTDDDSTADPVALAGCKPTGDPTERSHRLVAHRLVLPDGSVYDLPLPASLRRNVPETPTTPANGLLRRLRLPTLGSIEWDYGLYKFPRVSARSIWQRATGVGVRRLLNAAGTSIGQWDYETALSGGTLFNEKLLTNTVRDPLA